VLGSIQVSLDPFAIPAQDEGDHLPGWSLASLREARSRVKIVPGRPLTS
jgi:hypothetical protein